MTTSTSAVANDSNGAMDACLHPFGAGIFPEYRHLATAFSSIATMQSSIEISTICPFPVTFLLYSAITVPSADHIPAPTSAIDAPTLTQGPPLGPVKLISPLIA